MFSSPCRVRPCLTRPSTQLGRVRPATPGCERRSYRRRSWSRNPQDCAGRAKDVPWAIEEKRTGIRWIRVSTFRRCPMSTSSAGILAVASGPRGLGTATCSTHGLQLEARGGRNFPGAVRVQSKGSRCPPMFRRRQPADADAFGAEVLRYLEPLYRNGDEADAEPGRRRRPGAGHARQGTALLGPVRARHEPAERGCRQFCTTRGEIGSATRAARQPLSTSIATRLDEADAAADGSAGNETPEQLLLRKTLDVDLRAGARRVAGHFRQAVWLRDVEEFSYAEIAKRSTYRSVR